jgi:hypothetical protein
MGQRVIYSLANEVQNGMLVLSKVGVSVSCIQFSFSLLIAFELCGAPL